MFVCDVVFHEFFITWFVRLRLDNFVEIIYGLSSQFFIFSFYPNIRGVWKTTVRWVTLKIMLKNIPIFFIFHQFPIWIRLNCYFGIMIFSFFFYSLVENIHSNMCVWYGGWKTRICFKSFQICFYYLFEFMYMYNAIWWEKYIHIYIYYSEQYRNHQYHPSASHN